MDPVWGSSHGIERHGSAGMYRLGLPAPPRPRRAADGPTLSRSALGYDKGWGGVHSTQGTFWVAFSMHSGTMGLSARKCMKKLDDGHSASLGTAGAGDWAAVEGARQYQTVPALAVCTYLGMRSSDKTPQTSVAMASGCAAETGVLIPGLARVAGGGGPRKHIPWAPCLAVSGRGADV